MEHRNNYYSLKGPTNQEIIEKIKAAGVTTYQFERYYGIPQNTITQVLSGRRKLASKHWHHFIDIPNNKPNRKKPKTLVKPKKAKPQPVVTNALKELLQ